MYSITSEYLSPTEAEERFGQFISLSKPEFELPPGGVPGVEVLMPSPYESDIGPIPTLFIWLPAECKASLQKLCKGRAWDINWSSRNLLNQHTFLVFGPEEGGLYVPIWATNAALLHEERQTMRLVLIQDDAVVDLRHHITGDDLEIFTGGCQGSTASSGPNYQPYRIYGDDELAAVAHLGDGYDLPGHRVYPLKKITETQP